MRSEGGITVFKKIKNNWLKMLEESSGITKSELNESHLTIKTKNTVNWVLLSR